MNDAELTDRIAADFPKLKIERAKIVGAGWHHTAIEVNDTIIFRLPRGVHEQPVGSVIYEMAILKHLAGKLPVEIPNPLYIAPNNAYFGYPKLSGKILMDVYPSFSEKDKSQLVEDWVDTAIAIHREVSVDMARKLGIPDFDESDEDEELAKEARQILTFEGLDKAVMDFAKYTIEAASRINMKEHVSFIHNDLQFQNFLVDPKTNRITGLFDWTDICIGPLAREFSLGEWVRDETQLEKAISLYQRKTGIHVDITQAKTLKHLEEVSDLAEHIKTGDTEEAEQSLNRINYLISQTSSAH